MTVNHKRPVNLDLRSLTYPPMAIASILHRLSGVLLFVLLPVMLYVFHLSLQSPESFLALQNCLRHPFSKFIVWTFSAAMIYHLIAGVRHLCMDLGWGESLTGGRQSALAVMLLSAILIILLGIWIW